MSSESVITLRRAILQGNPPARIMVLDYSFITRTIECKFSNSCAIEDCANWLIATVDEWLEQQGRVRAGWSMNLYLDCVVTVRW